LPGLEPDPRVLQAGAELARQPFCICPAGQQGRSGFCGCPWVGRAVTLDRVREDHGRAGVVDRWRNAWSRGRQVVAAEVP